MAHAFNDDKSKVEVVTKAEFDQLEKLSLQSQEVEITAQAGSWSYKAVTVPENAVAIIPVITGLTGSVPTGATQVYIADQSGSDTTKLVQFGNASNSRLTAYITVYTFYKATT